MPEGLKTKQMLSHLGAADMICSECGTDNPPNGCCSKCSHPLESEGERFVLGVDLDGVCADFYGGLREIAAEWLRVPLESLTTEPKYGLPEWKVPEAPGGYTALHRFAVTQKNLFRDLKPLDGAPQVLRRLAHKERVRIRIITHRLFIPYFHAIAVQQTLEWLDRYDIPYWDLCLMKDKAAVGADLYLEDS
jgi:5'(3')-deoxyribonucleotidase